MSEFDILGLGTGPEHPKLSNNSSNSSSNTNNPKNNADTNAAAAATVNNDENDSKPVKSKSKKKQLENEIEELAIESEEELSESEEEEDEDVEFIDLPSEEDTKEFRPSNSRRRTNINLFDRYEWTEKQLILREEEFTSIKDLTVYCASWNVNAKKVHGEPDLSSWLLHNYKENNKQAADIYAVGFQEIVDLNAGSLFVDHNAAEPWEKVIENTLAATGYKYIQIATVHLVGLSLCVYAKEKHYSNITDIRTNSVGVGIMGVGGNKGAVIIRFNCYKTSICLVNAHLAAHQKNFKARNSDYHNILRKCVLQPRSFDAMYSRKYLDNRNRDKMQQINVQLEDEGDREEDDDIKPVNSNNNSNSKKPSDMDNLKSMMSSGFSSFKNKLDKLSDKLDIQGFAKSILDDRSTNSGIGGNSNLTEDENGASSPSNGLTIYDHDHIIWIGDLNYRLDVGEIGMEATHQLIQAKDFKQLLSYDQLLKQKKEKNAFVGFNEGKISFPPTYKYITGTDQYDRREDKKVRFPAYTDRIQWCTNNDQYFHLNFYTRAELKSSDHKPIMASFQVPFKAEIEKKKTKIKAQLDKLSDKQCQPRVKFNVKYIDLGELRFDIPIQKKLTIKNCGQTVVNFKVESLGIEEEKTNYNNSANNIATTIKSPFHSWLSIQPKEGIIKLDEQIILTLTVWVDRRTANSLNTESQSLNPFLFRVEGGKQYCIPFIGKYMKSTLGAALNYLNSLPLPIRSVTKEEIQANTKNYSVPHELFRLIDHINNLNGFKSKNVWLQQPNYATKGKTKQIPDYSKILPSPQIRYLCECLDTGRPFDNIPGKNNENGSAPTKLGEIDLSKTLIKLPLNFFIQTLLYWLHSLHKPVFYRGNYSNKNNESTNNTTVNSSLTSSNEVSFVDGMDLTSWCYQSTLELPAEHYRTFVYILTFLRQVLKESKDNGCTVENLSLIWAEPLTHLHPTKSFSPFMPLTPTQILKHFLTSPDFV